MAQMPHNHQLHRTLDPPRERGLTPTTARRL